MVIFFTPPPEALTAGDLELKWHAVVWLICVIISENSWYVSFVRVVQRIQWQGSSRLSLLRGPCCHMYRSCAAHPPTTKALPCVRMLRLLFPWHCPPPTPSNLPEGGGGWTLTFGKRADKATRHSPLLSGPDQARWDLLSTCWWMKLFLSCRRPHF